MICVTKEDILKKIVKKEFTVLEDGKTTICNIYLQNGFTVRGEASVVDENNFHTEIGQKRAFENGFEKIWVLEGYLLQEKIYQQKSKCTNCSRFEHCFHSGVFEKKVIGHYPECFNMRAKSSVLPF